MTKLHNAREEDGIIILSGGDALAGFHEAGACLGEHCPVHNPSEHELAALPLHFDGQHMVRRRGDELLVDPDDYLFNKLGTAILRNSARCRLCGNEIESIGRHDYVRCSCDNIAVDGGRAYIRHMAKDPSALQDTSIVFQKLEHNS